MSGIIKLIVKQTILAKAKKLAKASSNKFDDKFVILLEELIEVYL